MKNSIFSKLTQEEKRIISEELKKGVQGKSLASKYGVSPSTISSAFIEMNNGISIRQWQQANEQELNKK